MVDCVKCGREAEYDVPEDLCSVHWAIWWGYQLDVEDGEEHEKTEYLLEDFAGVLAIAWQDGVPLDLIAGDATCYTGPITPPKEVDKDGAHKEKGKKGQTP